MHKRSTRAFAALALGSALPILAGMSTVQVGGQPMLPTQDIIDNAVNSVDHTTLVAAVQAAGLVDTLKGDGPFTVFAPTNDAFENLPDGTVDTLLMTENKGTLAQILTYHVVPGSLDYDSLRKLIRSGEGVLTTVNGGSLTASLNGDRNIVLTDAAGGVASVSTYDVTQSNGVIHVIDSVLLPN